MAATETLEQFSIRAELHRRSDVEVIGSKVDTRSEAFAGICKSLDSFGLALRELFSQYSKAQKDLAGVGIETAKRMDAPLQAAYEKWLTEQGLRAEGIGEAPVPVITEDNA